MTEVPFAELWPAILSLAVVVGMFALFVSERYPTEVVAIGGAAVLLASGVLSTGDALGVFSNAAPWTIAAMFILSGALVRTGALSYFTGVISAQAGRNATGVIAIFALFILVASAFMNNTPVVVMMIPVTVRLAGTLGLAPSKLLIPLSYTTILGGMCTLIGTSTNLLVDGIVRSQGLEGFSLFSITPLAVILAVAGVAYMTVAAPRLLPDRGTVGGFLSEKKSLKFFTEVAIPEESPIAGRKVFEVDIFQRDGMRVIDVLRGDESLRRQFPDVVLAEGDRVVLRTGVDELLGLKNSRAVHTVDKLSSRKTVTVEALISPGCRLVGRALGRLRLRRRYGVYPLAVHRRNQNIGGIGRQLDDVVVRVGDTLLLEGAPEDIQRLAQDVDLVDIAQPTERPYRRGHAPIVLAVLGAVVVLSAFEVIPIFAASMIGVAIVLLTRCIDADEAFDFVEGRLLALIFAMLAVGAALESSGAINLVVGAIAPGLDMLPHWLLVAVVFMFTSILTEMISNNAVAVVMTPVMLNLAKVLDVDPTPLVVAVMLAASCCFATPIGYQTNTLVYGPGGYRFTDFMRIGVPMNLLLGIVASLLIPLFWPL
ncbi:SLC13 family permease [Oceanicella sp. SM1341]|uniref:SLC13 family permease n=1 Tax=Oceanicella sp. SM1341 TaxID=1548889 RepID=UPI0035148CCC